MGETNSKLETAEDSRRPTEANEVIEEYPTTSIDSEYVIINNSEVGGSSYKQNQDSHLKKKNFLRECLEKNIFLEGLVTSVFIDDNSLTDVFGSGITKAAHFSELGDIQTVLSAITQWCMKVHSKSENNKTQQATWFRKNDFKETIFKQIDKQLRNHYTDAVALMSELKRPTILNFNKDVLHVHETMMEIMAKLWYNRLCIYQGHKDLGYLQISSKVSGLIGRKSCYRLTNEPPRFVLALDALNNDHIPEELNLLVSIGDDLAASMLSKYHNTTPKDMIDQFFCIPVATEYMSFELGSLASSDKFCERLRVISGHVMKVLYDRDLKQMTVLCPKVGCDRVKSVLGEVLENLKAELEKKVLEIPFPYFQSPLRIQIGEGLECMVMIGVHPPKVQNFARMSYTSDDEEIYPTNKENQSIRKSRIEDQCISHHLSAAETAVELECFNESLIAKQKYILIDDMVIFDSSVEVILHCLIKDEVNDEKNGNVPVTCKDSKTMIMSDVIGAFAKAGLRADECEDSAVFLAETNLDTHHEFDLKIVFPNIYCARVGTKCIEGISRSDFSVFLRHHTKLATDLKTIRITMTQGFYQIIEKLLQEFMGKMQKENIVKHWIKQDQHVLVNPSSINLQVLVSVTTTENSQTRRLTQDLEDFFLPAKVSFDNEQLQYLQSNEGTKFLKFLMQFTNTCIHIPTFQETTHIYGDPSNKNKSANILKRQLTGKDNSCGLSWYLFDFDRIFYNSHALQNLFHSMKSNLDNLKRNSYISQYFLIEDRPELWLETTSEAYSRYSEEIKSTLLQHMDVPLDTRGQKPDLICSVCWRENLDASSADCYLLSVCGHAYCKKCMLQLIVQSTKDRKFPVKCCFENCDKSLSAAELWYICGVMKYYKIPKILRNVLKSFVMDNTASFGFCPRQRCGAMCVVYQTDKMKACLLCQGRFCLNCDCDFHGEKTCDEVWSIEAWLKADVKTRKRCPNCSIPIEKDEGCNVVYCAWCKNYICWACVQFHSEVQRECNSHAFACQSRIR